MLLNAKDHLYNITDRREPSIDPCRTPQITFLYSVLQVFWETIYYFPIFK